MKGGIRIRSQGVNCPPPLRQVIRAAGFPFGWFLPARGLFRNLEAPGVLVLHGLKVATQREMHREGADYALVLKAPGQKRAADIVGILGPVEIAACSCRTARLL